MCRLHIAHITRASSDEQAGTIARASHRSLRQEAKTSARGGGFLGRECNNAHSQKHANPANLRVCLLHIAHMHSCVKRATLMNVLHMMHGHLDVDVNDWNVRYCLDRRLGRRVDNLFDCTVSDSFLRND